MPHNLAAHHRSSIRLQGYDYTQAGVYFVTVVTYGRMRRFGKMDEDDICLNQTGQVAQGEWQRLESRFPGLVVDEFAIMPNHIHGIIHLPSLGEGTSPTVGARQKEDSMIDITLFASPLLPT